MKQMEIELAAGKEGRKRRRLGEGRGGEGKKREKHLPKTPVKLKNTF